MRLQLLHPIVVAQVLLASCLISKEFALGKRITTEDVETAIENALKTVSRREKLQSSLIGKGKFLDRYVISAEARHQLVNNMRLPFSQRVESVLEAATVELVSRLGLSNEEAKDLPNLQLDGQLGRMVTQECNDERPTDCNPNGKYRTIDGSCNNIERPNQGRTFGCHRRIAPSDYEDGVAAPRTQNDNLPNARQVSLRLHRITPANREINEPFVSGWHMSFGQFLDHDIEFTTQSTTVDNAPITCCDTTDLNPQCYPISLVNDPDFQSNCMNFVRDARCQQCTLGKREQMNSLTPYIDASQIYSPDERLATLLRTTNNDGKLKTRTINGVGERPSESLNPDTDQCSRPGLPCFFVGDFRGNQNPWLTSHQIIFTILHNQIVDELSQINPHWNGERKYQETRRIVAACLQHIVYQEYLPLVVGDEIMKTYSLYDDNTRYDSRLPTEIINVFAAAAFRLHSTVMDRIWSITETGQFRQYEFRDHFFNPTLMYQPGELENIVRGASRQPQQFFDNFLVRAVTQQLYQRLNVTDGLDLAAINIQRGRDHGLPGYTTYLNLVLNTNINSFRDLRRSGLVSPACFDAGLDRIYRSVDDIDVFTGLSCETHTGDSLVGLTTRKIIATQFHNLKYGDRFFYTHRGEAGSFSDAQLGSISKVLFSRIICNTLRVPEIPEALFEYSSPIVSCSDYRRIPTLDLTPWRERRPRG